MMLQLQITRRLLLSALIILMVNGTLPAAAQGNLDSQVDGILNKMTFDQKVGQLFMVSFSGVGSSDAVHQFLFAMQPGAIALFSANGTTPYEVTQTVNASQSIAANNGAKVPLIVAIDHEGGTVLRVGYGFTRLPYGAALGAMPPSDARKVGELAAEELSAVGINMNLGPVADVRSNPDIHFMEGRAFGADPELVGEAVSAYLQGVQAHGVIAVLKHFPGHGAAQDSHQALPTVNATRASVEATELVPFRMAIQNGAEGVMVGHLSYPALDPLPNWPATLSPLIIGNLLRNELGFKGVTISDSMDMGAIVKTFTQPRAAVIAIKSGIDIVATGPYTSLNDQLAMKQAVINAVNNGELPMQRIDEAARRILLLKAKYALLKWEPLDADTALDRVNQINHQPIVDAIYQDTVAIARDTAHVLPITPGVKTVGLVYPGTMQSILSACQALDPALTAYAYALDPAGYEVSNIHSLAKSVNIVIIFTYNISEHPRQADLVNAVPPNQAIVVALQSPYDIEQGIQPAGYVTAFNNVPAVHAAVCAVLYGKHPALGRWPLK